MPIVNGAGLGEPGTLGRVAPRMSPASLHLDFAAPHAPASPAARVTCWRGGK